MGTGRALKDAQQTLTLFYLMTADLAVALLNRAANGAELLSILDTIANDEADANIADCAAHYAALSAGTLQEVQF